MDRPRPTQGPLPVYYFVEAPTIVDRRKFSSRSKGEIVFKKLNFRKNLQFISGFPRFFCWKPAAVVMKLFWKPISKT